MHLEPHTHWRRVAARAIPLHVSGRLSSLSRVIAILVLRTEAPREIPQQRSRYSWISFRGGSSEGVPRRTVYKGPFGMRLHIVRIPSPGSAMTYANHTPTHRGRTYADQATHALETTTQNHTTITPGVPRLKRHTTYGTRHTVLGLSRPPSASQTVKLISRPFA